MTRALSLKVHKVLGAQTEKILKFSTVQPLLIKLHRLSFESNSSDVSFTRCLLIRVFFLKKNAMGCFFLILNLHLQKISMNLTIFMSNFPSLIAPIFERNSDSLAFLSNYLHSKYPM